MALFLLSENLGWIQGHFTFTELSLRYHKLPQLSARILFDDGIDLRQNLIPPLQ